MLDMVDNFLGEEAVGNFRKRTHSVGQMHTTRMGINGEIGAGRRQRYSGVQALRFPVAITGNAFIIGGVSPRNPLFLSPISWHSSGNSDTSFPTSILYAHQRCKVE
jgi:hypothetical protein